MYQVYGDFVPEGSQRLITSDSQVFQVKVNIPDSVTVDLYKNIGEINRLDKTQFLTQVGTVGGVFRDDVSILSPTMELEYSTFPDFNYVYIREFNRYYFVSDIVAINSTLYNIILDIDVLYSYKDALLNLTAFIDRNENVQDKLIVDNRRIVYEGQDVVQAHITNTLFDTVYQFVLNGFFVNSTPADVTEGGET